MCRFHDHALGTTSENTYAGLEGVHMVMPCTEPYNLQNIPQYIVHFLDVVLDGQCQMVYDKAGAHFNNLFGDINTVNGVNFPPPPPPPPLPFFLYFGYFQGSLVRCAHFDNQVGGAANVNGVTSTLRSTFFYLTFLCNAVACASQLSCHDANAERYTAHM